MNFERLYNATETISTLVSEDLAFLLEGRLDIFLHQIQMHVPEYLNAASDFIEYFGITEMVNANDTDFAMIRFLTGLYLIEKEIYIHMQY